MLANRRKSLGSLRPQSRRLSNNEEAQTVTVTIRAKKHGKLGYPTFSYSDDFVSDIILPAIRGKEYTARLFYNGKRRYQQLLLALNKQLSPTNQADWITFHYLRHSRITYLARNLQATPEELKGWTGHRSNAFDEYIASRKVKRFAGQLSTGFFGMWQAGE